MKNIKDYLDRDEVETILTAASTQSERDYLIIRTMWRTGMRVSELVAMTPSDIEEANRVINIVVAKGGKQRRVLVDGETVNRLTAYSAKHTITSDRPIFPLSTRHVYRIVNRYGPLVNKPIHPHTLRHSYAINLVRNGMDIRRVQLLLGHANLNTTQVYLQFRDSDIREAYDAVAF